ncbi:MAG TPA: putative toxin-antitoxin system toxin component, PIN family [Accumulibacter sp.]|uniref:putative toxin-antitoxin system toxin component, PIN family n=1 Tax=Accumulibacter sp. TaxID=2053492 RepID=UPI002B67A751|nr:putative toxin-antitoxin system toxin component, PIN family [Accumulibacter sp.]HMW55734.1 putative toxin-antitoxin system toxin component, PIN family [Accumulibacter sp.]
MLDAIRSRGEARLFTSPALLDELADVLTRPSATKRLAIIGRMVREVLADYVEAMEVVEPEHVPRVVPDDADDDQVIAAALAAGADWVVSGDADLLTLGSYQNIPILSAAQAVQRIAG